MKISVYAAIVVSLLLCSRANAETYEVNVDVLWNSTDHPTNYPGNAHFSPLIGASHKEVMTVWASGQAAIPNVELLAEAGDRSGLGAMFDASPNVLTKFMHPAPTDAPGAIGPLAFEVNNEFPLVTFATMIAPSPDWFVGVSRLDLRDNGSFVDSLTVDLFAYDAGTEDGTTFDPNGATTTPQGVIALVDQAALFGGTAPVARATFTQVVPEPGTAGLILCASIGLLAVARKRRRFVATV